MKLIDFKALRDALGISMTIFLAVVVFLLGIDDFLSRIMGFDGNRLQIWMDICSNLLFMFVIVAVVLYALNAMREK
jgi:hypothetical protein